VEKFYGKMVRLVSAGKLQKAKLMFVRNRGELSNGWYDPSTMQKSLAAPPQESISSISRDDSLSHTRDARYEASDSDDSVGPALPGQERRSKGNIIGPGIPNMQDLELKREMDIEDGLGRRDDIRFERKQDRRDQKDALDELLPRAAAGTRERQLEKKKEVNEKMKSFREKSPGAAEVPDNELMGGGDGVGEYKKIKDNYERKKNERELRKEEILRARLANFPYKNSLFGVGAQRLGTVSGNFVSFFEIS